MEYQTERTKEMPICARIQPKYWGCLRVEYTPVFNIFFGEQCVSANLMPVSLTPSIPNQAPAKSRGKETIRLRIAIDRPAIEMTKSENIGMMKIGCGETHSPIQNMNSNEEIIA